MIFFFLIKRFRLGDRIDDSIVSVNWCELKIAHGGNKGVRDFDGLTKGVQVDSKVAFRGSIYGRDEGCHCCNNQG